MIKVAEITLLKKGTMSSSCQVKQLCYNPGNKTIFSVPFLENSSGSQVSGTHHGQHVSQESAEILPGHQLATIKSIQIKILRLCRTWQGPKRQKIPQWVKSEMERGFASSVELNSISINPPGCFMMEGANCIATDRFSLEFPVGKL